MKHYISTIPMGFLHNRILFLCLGENLLLPAPDRCKEQNDTFWKAPLSLYSPSALPLSLFRQMIVMKLLALLMGYFSSMGIDFNETSRPVEKFSSVFSLDVFISVFLCRPLARGNVLFCLGARNELLLLLHNFFVCRKEVPS